MQGLHLTADLHNCRCASAWLTDAVQLGDWCLKAVQAAGLQAINHLFHGSPATAAQPGGITATVLLAQSHVCVHTWPAQKGVALDVYVCDMGNSDHSAKARQLMQLLIDRFAPEWTEQRSLDRGDQ